ncbi:MAG: ribosome biogenesis GTPase YlqF [Candidatus Eremiobacteraeota bacterium]|nr:ribosome biogenesis GTPase YlqF [Candidatus Eremiobacteraeota bacterium]
MKAIQWYPGHMAAAMRRLEKDVRLSDVVIEVVDARIVRSGRNPALARLAGTKPRLVVLEREDLANPHVTAAWLRAFAQNGEPAVAINGKSKGSTRRLKEALLLLAAGKRQARSIVVGIPNAGKSTVINALAGTNLARVENRAGVTRAPQWFRVEPRLDVLDTAGILVPKIDTPDAQWKLALCGAVPRARFDAEEIIAPFVRWAQEHRIDVPDLSAFARERGFVRRGNTLDTHNAAWSYIKEFNDGAFGRMTLEPAP